MVQGRGKDKFLPGTPEYRLRSPNLILVDLTTGRRCGSLFSKASRSFTPSRFCEVYRYDTKDGRVVSGRKDYCFCFSQGMSVRCPGMAHDVLLIEFGLRGFLIPMFTFWSHLVISTLFFFVFSFILMSMVYKFFYLVKRGRLEASASQ